MGDWDDKTIKVPRAHHRVEPEADASSMGNLLRMSNPDLTTDHLQEALDHQKKHPGMKLGEAMVALGYIKEEKVQEACENQVLLRLDKPSQKRTALIMAQVDIATKQVGKLDSMVEGITDLVDQMLAKLSNK